MRQESQENARLIHLETLASQAIEDHHLFRAQLLELERWRADTNIRLSTLEQWDSRMSAEIDKKHEENKAAMRSISDTLKDDRERIHDMFVFVNKQLSNNTEALARIAGGVSLARWGVATLIAAATILLSILGLVLT